MFRYCIVDNSKNFKVVALFSTEHFAQNKLKQLNSDNLSISKVNAKWVK